MMPKVHRTYKYTWWKPRFEKLGLFGPVTITEHGMSISNSVIHDNIDHTTPYTPQRQLRWLRATLEKMDEAKEQSQDWNTYFQEEYGSDWAFLSDDEKHRLLMWADTVPAEYVPVLEFA